jgi:putative DNA primase/helicase
MRNFKYDASDIRDKASGRWIDIFTILASNTFGKAVGNFTGKYSKNSREFCPVHGGKSGEAFYLYKDSNHTGGGGCNSCGSHSDGISLLMWANDWSYPECLEKVAEALNMDASTNTTFKSNFVQSTELTQEEIAQDNKRITKRDKIINECIPLSSPKAIVAKRYFARRGLSNVSSLGNEVLFHPGLDSWLFQNGSFKKEGTFPAIVAVIRNKSGDVMNIHRTFLTPDGYKANIESPRKVGAEILSKPVTGGAVQISPPSSVMGIAEGLETTLAVMEGTKLAMNCVLNTSLMKSYLPPVGVRVVIIFADNDKNNAGIDAAQVLYDKLTKLGYTCIIALPEEEEDLENVDWENVLELYGVDGFPEIPEF